MDSIQAIGGVNLSVNRTHYDSCLQLNRNSLKFKKVAKMIDARSFAACELFAGNIVVSGGFSNQSVLKSVESFEFFTGAWTRILAW